jgi:hypothetical protein
MMLIVSIIILGTVVGLIICEVRDEKEERDKWKDQ